jgi:hypothetical protein
MKPHERSNVRRALTAPETYLLGQQKAGSRSMGYSFTRALMAVWGKLYLVFYGASRPANFPVGPCRSRTGSRFTLEKQRASTRHETFARVAQSALASPTGGKDRPPEIVQRARYLTLTYLLSA